jgi:hypothetical protein
MMKGIDKARRLVRVGLSLVKGFLDMLTNELLNNGSEAMDKHLNLGLLSLVGMSRAPSAGTPPNGIHHVRGVRLRQPV